ncbi:hypothetical protein N431DRAFT_362953 [Stipitochalara longipes BDJ]|nr:hypothetical protein N431DRAFT_362953 [Stipitochalara longipes BDJ]
MDPEKPDNSRTDVSHQETGSHFSESKIVFEELEGEPQHGKPPLAFVNYTGPVAKTEKDPSTQRSIRRHVMRDIGRSRRAPNVSIVPDPVASSLLQATQSLNSAGTLGSLPESAARCCFTGCYNPGPYNEQPIMKLLNPGNPIMYCSEHQSIFGNPTEAAALQIELQHMVNLRQLTRVGSGRIDPFLPYPIKLTPRVRRFIDHIFGNIRKNTVWYREAIFPLGASGEASFHQMLSNMALYLRLSRSLDDTGYIIRDEMKYEWNEEVAHQAKVYRLVNNLIATKDATSEDAIGAVAALTCYAHIAQEMRALTIHMGALRKMVDLRGGIETLDSNKFLRISLYWIDVNVCCTTDDRPWWPVPIQWYPRRPPLPSDIELPYGAKAIVTQWRQQLGFVRDENIIQIFEEMALFSVHTENEERRTASAIYEDADFTGTFINIFLFHLLKACPLSEDIDANATLGEAVRLGLLLFLACLKRRFGLYPVTFKIHIEKLVAVLSRFLKEWQTLPRLKLWIISMGLLEAADETHIAPLKSEWVKALQEEGIEGRYQAETIVKGIMWIESIHGKRYLEVQNRFWGSGEDHPLQPGSD